jgi:hypothetical protein
MPGKLQRHREFPLFFQNAPSMHEAARGGVLWGLFHLFFVDPD